MSESTQIRVNRSTVEELRRVAIEISYNTKELLSSDDDRLCALIDHWYATKDANHQPAAAQDSTGVTPSPR